MSPEAGPAGTLNPRQLDYLRAAYEIDQRQEAHHKRSFNAGDWGESRRPASEWRWIPFGRFLHLRGQPPTPLREACPDVDEGSGSTWSALGRRGLLEVQERPVYLAGGAYRLLHVHLFPKGRKLARSLKTEQPPAPPKGSNSRWTWRALATAYAAGEEGVPGAGGGTFGGIGWALG